MYADPVTRIYAHAEALRTLAHQLNEAQGGLALIIRLMADDIESCSSAVEEAEQHIKPNHAGSHA